MSDVIAKGSLHGIQYEIFPDEDGHAFKPEWPEGVTFTENEDEIEVLAAVKEARARPNVFAYPVFGCRGRFSDFSYYRLMPSPGRHAFIGYIILEEEDADGIPERSDPRKFLSDTLEIYEKWANGQVFGFYLIDRHGEFVSPHGGYIGDPDSPHLLEAIEQACEELSLRTRTVHFLIAFNDGNYGMYGDWEDRTWMDGKVSIPYLADAQAWARENYGEIGFSSRGLEDIAHICVLEDTDN